MKLRNLNDLGPESKEGKNIYDKHQPTQNNEYTAGSIWISIKENHF